MTGLMRSPTRLLVAAAAILCLTALVSSVSVASPSRALHVTKDCSGSTVLPGAFCTIRSSNLKAIKVGSRVFYFQRGGKTSLDSDIALYVGPGNIAAGHCFLKYSTSLGLCTFSDGTGTLAGFHARVRVSADSTTPSLYHWDGTYSFSPP